MIDPTPDSRSRRSPARSAIVVLLVDDQAFVGAALRLLLESEPDIELHTCLSAVNAIAMANAVAPTLILQDLLMPEMDGLTLVRAFRANPQTAATPIVVLSGNDDTGSRARALAEGAKGYLVKLPPKADLIACIRRQAAGSAGGSVTLDPAVMDGFRDAPDFSRRLIDQFIREACGRVQALQEAAVRADAHALNAGAHSLKGSSMIMGASRLAELCAQVEEQVAIEPGGEVTAALVAEIEHELVRVQDALESQREAISQK
jgi:DNA-binding NarL/FixJ family response regulator